MGTWGTGITDNDNAADVYDEYFELYNSGKNATDITRKLISDYNETIITEVAADFWLPLALAQWETNSLTQLVVEQVDSIITSGADLEVWRELDASEEDIAERKVVLDNFLLQIKQPNPSPVLPNQSDENIDTQIGHDMNPANPSKPWWKFW